MVNSEGGDIDWTSWQEEEVGGGIRLERKKEKRRQRHDVPASQLSREEAGKIECTKLKKKVKSPEPKCR